MGPLVPEENPVGMSPSGIEAAALDSDTSSRHSVKGVGRQYVRKVIAHFGSDFALRSIITRCETDSLDVDELFVEKPLEN